MIKIYRGINGCRRSLDTWASTEGERFPETMAASNKTEWRNHWIHELVDERSFRVCNFVTLPGPKALDVKALSHKANVCASVLIEKKSTNIPSICKSIDELSDADMVRGLNALGIHRLFDNGPKHAVVWGQFERLVDSGKLINIAKNTLQREDTIVDLDFCGTYTQKQHDTIVRFIRELRQLPIRRLAVILNFVPLLNFSTAEKLHMRPLRDCFGFPVRMSRISKVPSVVEAAERFGHFLENLSPELVRDLDVGAEVLEPYHYHNGGVNMGYTTNLIIL